ncbi:glutamate--cysteine ligase [uncultured Cocleimonas sp.]|uniref:glutamate--cysteine ligase n=1 Tax=uncultured Cocleimonas sp. TaxID=1051587 RepID=UPI002634F57F|nr:glutamate--cysteine ligase [uncultured Cocleimonas sp.]
MGQEISHSHFTSEESKCFKELLIEETKLLKKQFEAGEFSSHKPMGGFEIEAWLVDKSLRPAPINNEFFDLFDNPLATPELAKFNIELNNTPLPLTGNSLKEFESEIRTVLSEADAVTEKLKSNIILIGTLPTAVADDFCLENMSSMKRYEALNEIVLNARNNKPLHLDINGEDHCHLTKHSVMIEAATTSFQIHIQTPWKQAHHYYNASIIASAPIMAIAGNSPVLFGDKLWHETRIPLFEQAIETGGKQRVSFGSGYAESSILECFEENLNDYSVFLPMIFNSQPKDFKHLSLHNGVIWRWNRPLVGFDPDGTPHIRIEHRILPAGPTVSDMMANATFFYGLTQSIMERISNQEKMPFETAKNNFYEAAQYGLQGEINWEGNTYSGDSLQQLIVDKLIPLAEQGLQQLDLEQASIDHYLNIIKERTISGQTGSVWQIYHLNQHHGDLTKMTADYLALQHIGQPVHTWAHN